MYLLLSHRLHNYFLHLGMLITIMCMCAAQIFSGFSLAKAQYRILPQSFIPEACMHSICRKTVYLFAGFCGILLVLLCGCSAGPIAITVSEQGQQN